ncbi:MAG: DNA topoisomerase IB [Nocardioidaceae bacterium]|nr:DNA topoisomerase IB [Nocardioidaceae bacterium]
MRLRTVSCQEPGWRRVRHGRGFRYLDAAGAPLPPEDVARVKALVIPPAWTYVWICPHPRGHLQAVGTDDAGRRQYLYHPAWREQRDLEKFERVQELARRLPGMRRRLRRQLRTPDDPRERVLAAAVRLIDLGCFRLGAEQYAEENGSHGLTTLERRHLRRENGGFRFAFVGKAGIEHEVHVEDPDVCAVLDELARARRGADRLLAAKDGRRWKPVTPEEINEHVRAVTGLDVTAKDFRTWHATVTVAVALAATPRAASATARKRQVRAAVEEAARLLGNTPAVARASYVDPRVVDLFDDGTVLDTVPRGQDSADRAVVRLLDARG